MKIPASNLPTIGGIVLLLGVLASTVALALNGSITGTDAKDLIFAVLGLFGVGGGAVAGIAGIKSATAHVAALNEATRGKSPTP